MRYVVFSFWFLCCLSAAPVFSQLVLEKDINDEGQGSEIDETFLYKGYLYFGASDGTTGNELWRLNLEDGATERLGDFREGILDSDPSRFVATENNVYCVATDNRSDDIIFQFNTDTETSGPLQPLNISPVFSNDIFVHDGLLIMEYRASDRSDEDLGIYDENTNELTVISVNLEKAADINILGIINNTVWFTGLDENDVDVLWEYDIINETFQKSTIPDPLSVLPTASGVLVDQNRMYFSGFTAEERRELYALDIDQNEVIVYPPIRPGASGGDPLFITRVGDLIYFRARGIGARQEVYELDPSTDEITLITDLCNCNSGLGGFVSFNDVLYFTADNGSGRAAYRLVNDSEERLVEFDAGLLSNQLNTMYVDAEYIYFAAYRADVGRELWRYAFDTEEVRLVDDINPNTIGSFPSEFAELNDKLYFVASPPQEGGKLFVYDPSDGSVELVTGTEEVFRPGNLRVFNGRLYFDGSVDGVYGIYFYDVNTGTLGNTSWQTPGRTGGISDIVPYQGSLYFQGYTEDEEVELYRYNPETDISELVVDVNPEDDSRPEDFVVFNDQFFFSATSNTAGRELFRYDAQTDQTVLFDIVPGPEDSRPGFYNAILDGLMYFFVQSGPSANQLLRFDPNSEEISVLTDIDRGLDIDYLTVFDNNLYFEGRLDNRITSELLYYDIQLDSVVLAADLNGSSRSSPRDLIVFNDNLYFVAETEAFGDEVWVYDGNGAQIVTDINPGTASAEPDHFVVFNEKLYFSADDGTRGEELWSLAACLNVVVERTTPEIDDEPTGSIDISVQGGRQPYEYIWSSGETTQDLENLEAGTYTLEVRDQSGCLSTITIEIVKETSTSNAELTQVRSIFVAPNPVAGETALFFKDGFKGAIVVRDVQGIVYEQRAVQALSGDRILLNTSKWRSGMYILECMQEDGARRIIKVLKN